MNTNPPEYRVFMLSNKKFLNIEIPLISNLKVRNKILLGFILIVLIFIIGMFASYSSSQDLATTNRAIVDKYSVINSQSYELSLAYDTQQSLYQSYASGNVTGTKQQFIQTENSLDINVSELENNTVGTNGKPIVDSIKASRLQFYDSVVNGLMNLPTQNELNSLQLDGESMLKDALNMYANMIEYQLTGNISQDNSYKVDKAQFITVESDFSGNLTEIQGINSSIYSIFNADYTTIQTYFTSWVNNVMDPASADLSSNGTAWVISHTDSITPIENALLGIDRNISGYDQIAQQALSKADSDIAPIQINLVHLRTFSQNEMQVAKVKANNAVNMVTMTTITVSVAGILLSVFIGFAIAGSISNPLTSLASNSKTIASGDLTIDVHDSHKKRQDEIGELASHFNQMVEYLRSTVIQISDVASSLSAAAQEMASSSEEVNSSSEEISAISQQMAKGAVDQSNQINQTVDIALDLKKNFEEKISNINQTSSLIENISSQVNMLALNASIEAARAGEYGRGFSVVADNIRKLADDSKNSVANVQIIITSLKETISKSIDNLTFSIEKISAVAEETSSGAEETSAATEEQAATMEEMSASAQELANIAGNLEQIIKKFKLVEN